MNTANQYAAPAARLEREEDEAYGEVRPFSPRGRLGRIRYLWYSTLYVVIFALVALPVFLLYVSGTLPQGPALGLLGALYLALVVFQFILVIQRCHDFNATGWLSLLLPVPLIGAIFALVLLFMPGTGGPNGYGPPPPHPRAMTLVAVGLLITVFLGGILAAIAVPAYNNFVERARMERLEQAPPP